MVRELLKSLFRRQPPRPWRLTMEQARRIGEDAARKDGLPPNQELRLVMAKVDDDGRQRWHITNTYRGARWTISVDDETGSASQLKCHNTR